VIDGLFAQTVLITCLPSPHIVKVLFQGILKDGQLPPLELERLFIDCSTIDPPSSKEVAESVHTSHSGSFVDAPVSGGTVGARAGTLSFMFGAPKSSQLLGRVKSVLSLMGKSSWYMGEQGAGVSSKLVNNYILSITNIATAEGLNMGRQWGLDLKTLTELIKSSTGRCWPLEANNPVPGVDENAPASHGYKPGGTVNIVKKDLGLAMAGAEASGTSLPLASAAYKVYQDVGESDGGKDFSIVYQWLQNRSSS
jgi:3-hydroxyisobutyrate dehydrogenase